MNVIGDNFDIKTVIMRGIASTLADDALRMDDVEPVDMKKAMEQHETYYKIFKDQLQLNVIVLDADDTLPDCVFVEDPAVVIGQTALVTTPGHPSRRKECDAMLETLQSFKGLDIKIMKHIDPTANLDGGDVLFTGDEIFVGLSKRTNEAGIKVLEGAFPDFSVISISIHGSLHLKSVCTLGGRRKILIGSDETSTDVKTQIEKKSSVKYEFLEVKDIPCSANSVYLEIDGKPTLIHPSTTKYPLTGQVYKDLQNIRKIECDLSELSKVDGCLTCSSLLLTV
ncbi:N(G),N(G)-dimethylarginine dimethylaminohydrolase 1-like isoform X2 [Ciona intestinalis]